MNEERRRARAVLGVEPDITPPELRMRYRALVRRWHPDRFATDPRSQAEAEARMREINHAYQVLTEEPPAEAGTAPAAPPPYTPPQPGARLSREQIDRMVEAIGTEGAIDGLFRVPATIGNGTRVLFTVLGAIYGGLSLLAALRRGDPMLLILLAAGAIWAIVAFARRERGEE